MNKLFTIIIVINLLACAGTESKKKSERKMSFGNKNKFEAAHRSYLNSLKAKETDKTHSLRDYEFYAEQALDCKKKLDSAKESGLDLSTTLDFSFRKDALDKDVAKEISAEYLYAKCEESITTTKLKLDDKLKSEDSERSADRISQYGEVIFEFMDKPKGKPKQEFACGESIYTNMKFKNFEGGDSSLTVVMKADGKEVFAPQSFYIFLPSKFNATGKINDSVEYALTPTGEMAKKDPETYRDQSHVAFYNRLLKVKPGQTEFTFELYGSGTVGNGKLKINCDDFSNSPYVTKLNDFEEGLIEGNTFPKQNFNAGLIPSITKEYEKYSEGEFKIKLIRVLSANEEIFGTKVNGSYTDIIGKGYAIAIGTEYKDGKCKVSYGSYHKPFEGRIYDTKYVIDIKKSERIKCANIK